MAVKSIESTFCFQFLNRFIGLKAETIETLVANDYDSIESLRCLDLTLDLKDLPNISMGQKSILRNALLKLKQEFERWISEDMDPLPMLRTPTRDLNLISTPIRDHKDWMNPFVKNNDSFNEFIETAIKDSIKGQALPQSPASKPDASPVNNRTDGQSVDSGINPHFLSEVLNPSPAKRSRRLDTKTNDIFKEKNKMVSKNPNERKSSEKKENIEKSSQNEIQRKRKRKKFLYSFSSRRNRSRVKEEREDGYRDNSAEQLGRSLHIDIDSETTLNSISGQESAAEEELTAGHESDSHSIGANKKRTKMIAKTTEKKTKVEKKEKKSTGSSSSSSSSSSTPFNADSKSKKLEITGLLKSCSERLELIEDIEWSSALNKEFKCIALDGVVVPFVSCNSCHSRQKSRIFVKNIGSLRTHLKSCQKLLVPNDSNGSVETQLETPQRSEERGSADERVSQSTSAVLGCKKRGRPLKRHSSQLDELQLMKTVSIPQILLTQLQFKCVDDSYSVDVSDTGSGNESHFVVSNYSQALKESRPKKESIEDQKRYRCEFEGCQFAAIYPFSLEQHRIKHKDKAQNRVRKEGKLKEYSVLKGMNNMIAKHMNRSTAKQNESLMSNSQSDQTVSQTNSDTNQSSNPVIVCDSEDNSFVCDSDDSLNQNNISLSPNRQSFECQSPDCNYRSKWKLSVKQHMRSYHNLFIDRHNSSEADDQKGSNENKSISEKIVDKIHKLIKTNKTNE